MKLIVKRSVQFLVCVSFAVLISAALFSYAHVIKEWFNFSKYSYTSTDSQLKQNATMAQIDKISWSELIPDNERAVLEKYQSQEAKTAIEFSEQVLLSIEASADSDYQSALQSINTVNKVNDEVVSIAGFIVPINYDNNKNLRDIFIVPYFGACIHFPPPPPNQMIFARLSGEFTDFDLNQAYRIVGVITQQMFDDPMGTSAYGIEVINIKVYKGEPDDFRQH